MNLRFLFVTALFASFFLLFTQSCAKYEGEKIVTAPAPVGTPSANGKAVWNYITEVAPYKQYQFWPGKTALYKGTMPHGALLTLYVDNKALKAVNEKLGVMPNGAMLVKENYMPDQMLGAITVMYKVAGYNPEAGNWFWAKYSPTGEIMAEGKAPMCIECHETKKANDYLMTGDIK
ncbi:MAG TPA: cytochrome P460 family protein [Candidatus Tripitaka californicus]|uniref:cytochrome P460 family protein n=1 Tax=Candidatus Tripitaka californicus TaxID=3367616 RepID=UPI00402760AA|nr:cytochrome P460 family protein [Planctomycetota bacterium]